MVRAKLILLAAAAYFLVHAAAKTGEPLKVFEWEYFSAAESALVSGVPAEYGTGQPAVEHPPLYVHLLAAVMKFAGVSVPAARWAGVVMALLSFLPLFMLARSLGAGWPGFALSALLLLLSPALIQGSGVIGAADTGLYPPLMLLFCWSLLELRSRGAFFLPAAVFFALCLWAKLTTSLVLPAVFLGWRAAERDWPGLRRELGLFAAGAGLFAASWGAYCFFVPGLEHFAEPLTYPFPQLAAGLPEGGPAEKLLRAAGELARVAAWFSPFLLFAALPSPDERGDRRVLALLGWLLLLGYTAVRGTSAGFPKYQLPALFLLCLYAGLKAERRLSGLGRGGGAVLIAVLAAAFAWHRLALGDPLLRLNSLLRLAAAGFAATAARESALWAALYLLPFAAALPAAAKLAGWGGARSFFLVSVSFAFGYNISQNALQRVAPYSTANAYGTAGAAEAAAFVRSRTSPGDTVIGAFETLYSAGNTRALLMPERAWNDAGAFLEYLGSVSPEAVVVGTGTNTAAQQSAVFGSARVRRALLAAYEEHVFGSYAVWLRKERQK